MFSQRTQTLLLLSCLASAAACSPSSQEVPREARAGAISGGGGDVDTPAANVVVKLSDGGGTICTGTLITPTAVLTARHCVNGDSKGNRGFVPAVSVQIGARGNLGLYTVSTRQQSFATFPDAQTIGAWGNDLAVMFLDAGQFVIDSPSNSRRLGPQPYIVRPSLVDPSPLPNLGMAGWSPSDSSVQRQLAYDNSTEFDGYEGDPDGWYTWEHIQGTVHVNPGDSGGPLFIDRFDAAGNNYREIIGVLSGHQIQAIGHDYDKYADITGATPAANWLRSIMVDESRTARWHAQHPGYSWKGEVEYQGACNTTVDPDCDHWTNAHDNCPNQYNPDQWDSLDNGIGDACRADAVRRVSTDFNLNGLSDILWRDATGQTAIWFMSGGAIAGKAYPGGPDPSGSWKIQGTGDFDGNGRADILWRDVTGQTAIWFMNGGTIAGKAYPGGPDPGGSWKIQGTGDFDGNGRADILWRDVTGQTAIWFMNGGTIASKAYPGGPDPGGSWKIEGTGDFDGNGRADILWRDVTGQTAIWFMNGGTIAGKAYPGGPDPGGSWKIQGTGDFDGNGRADILWRDVTGQTAIWFMNGGTIAGKAYPGGPDPGGSWKIQGTGDFDGNGRADILWRDVTGQTAIWFMSGGTIAGKAYPGGPDPSGSWKIQPQQGSVPPVAEAPVKAPAEPPPAEGAADEVAPEAPAEEPVVEVPPEEPVGEVAPGEPVEEEIVAEEPAPEAPAGELAPAAPGEAALEVAPEAPAAEDAAKARAIIIVGGAPALNAGKKNEVVQSRGIIIVGGRAISAAVSAQ